MLVLVFTASFVHGVGRLEFLSRTGLSPLWSVHMSKWSGYIKPSLLRQSADLRPPIRMLHSAQNLHRPQEGAGFGRRPAMTGPLQVHQMAADLQPRPLEGRGQQVPSATQLTACSHLQALCWLSHGLVQGTRDECSRYE